MPYPLNNFTTQDNYVSSGEVIFSPPKRSFNAVITGASINYQLAVGSGQRHPAGESYGPETFLPPGRYTFNADDSHAQGGDGTLAAFKIRSAVASTPAQVTVI